MGSWQKLVCMLREVHTCCSTQHHHIFHLKSILRTNVLSTFENNLFLLLIYTKKKKSCFIYMTLRVKKKKKEKCPSRQCIWYWDDNNPREIPVGWQCHLLSECRIQRPLQSEERLSLRLIQSQGVLVESNWLYDRWQMCKRGTHQQPVPRLCCGRNLVHSLSLRKSHYIVSCIPLLHQKAWQS